MLLEIKGSTKRVRKLVEIAAWNYAERLMGKRMLKNLSIKIELNRMDLFLGKGTVACRSQKCLLINFRPKIEKLYIFDI